MQDLTVGKVIKDSSCPGGSFGAAASSHRQKEPVRSCLGCHAGAEKWKSDQTVNCKMGTTRRDMGTASPKSI